MEALRQLLIARTGYPAYRSIAQAARDSGVAQSLLSQYVRGTRRPDPPVLYRIAAWLKAPYDPLLVEVWGARSFESQPDHDSGKDDSSTDHTRVYVWQEAVPTPLLMFPQAGDRQRALAAA